MPALHLLRARVDEIALRVFAQRTGTQDDDLCYALHLAMRRRWGAAAPQPFRWPAPGSPGVLLGYSADPAPLLAPPPAAEPPDWTADWQAEDAEADLLRAFWVLAGNAEVVVSYNGRGFDVPFVQGRSLIHGIDARVDLLSNRYSLRPHLDLYYALGQMRGPSSLDVVCWALGLTSPKEDMDGSMVATTYEKGDIASIALYNAGDVRATTGVYQHVRDRLLRFRDDW